MEEHGQPFLFRPRPPRPPILIGGSAPHAFGRVVRFGDGWMPFGMDADELAPQVAALRARMAAAGRDAPRVVAVHQLDLRDPARAAARVRAFAAAGATDFVHGWRYTGSDDFRRAAEVLAALER